MKKVFLATVLAWLFCMYFVTIGRAQTPTSTPEPTPTVTPVAVNVATVGFVEQWPNEIVGFSWAVGIIFCFAMIANSKSRSTDIMAFLAILIFCAPIWFVNLAAWVVSIVVWFALYVIITRFQGVIKS